MYGRQDNTEKVKTYIRDSENSMLYSPNDQGNRYFGSWSKFSNLRNMLNHENKEKYLNEFQAKFNSKLEVGSIPVCFDLCITEVEESGLSSDEKNCMRECYLRRVSSRDDLNMLYQQRLTLINTSNLKDTTI